MPDSSAGSGARQTGLATLDLPTVLRFADLAVEALGEAREEIDALNVYPVPDGDTGTNMFLTFEAARDAMRDALADGPEDGDLRAGAGRVRPRRPARRPRQLRGDPQPARRGARAGGSAEAGPDDRSAAVFAGGARRRDLGRYAAVGRPVEGTILTVARAASDAAGSSGARRAAPARRTWSAAAAAAARVALARTPDQLQVLATPGSSTPAGAGSAWSSTPPRPRSPASAPSPRHARRSAPGRSRRRCPTDDLTEDGPAYEVMYLLDAADDADPGAAPRARARSATRWSSSAATGSGTSTCTSTTSARAVEAGIEAGPALPDPGHPLRRAGRAPGRRQPPTRAPVARWSWSPPATGWPALFAEAGAVVVRRPGRAGRPPGQILDGDRGDRGGARSWCCPTTATRSPSPRPPPAPRARTSDVRVAVIPTRAQVQGLAALAVHEPGRSFDQDVVAMTAAARHARSGAVTVAAKQAMTIGRARASPATCSASSRATSWSSATTCSRSRTEVLERLLGGGGELVTLVVAAPTPATSASAVARAPRGGAPDRRRRASTTVARSATRC